MSRSIGKHSLLKAVAKRNYSAQAAPKAAGQSNVSVDVSTKLIRLVSVNENSPLAKISFSFKAGSRYESPDSYGITHLLRKAIGLGTKEFTPFNIARNLQQYGINLYTSVDRETFTVTVESHPDKYEIAFHYLNSVSTEPQFKPWEVSDNRPRVRLELLTTTPQARTIDLLHTAAYRTGLGNSLFIDPTRIDTLNNEHLMKFHNDYFTARRAQITATGVSLSTLNELVAHVNLDPVLGPEPEKTSFIGGELRIPNYEEPNAFIAVAGEAPGYSKKNFLPYAVLSHVYGNSPSIPYGGGQGILNKALTKTGAVASVSGIRANYSDSGLVGFFLVADSGDATKAYDAVMDAFLKADITDQDVARGKSQLKAAIALNEDNSSIVDYLASQIAVDSITTPKQLLAAVDSVTTADVKQAAKKIAEGKLASAVYGDTAPIPVLESYKK